MQVINFSDFRNQLKANLDHVSQDNETVIVSRPRNENVVVISLREYNAMQETLHLLGTDKNRERLLTAVERDKAGIQERHEIIEK
jgi:antitoxin YefM